MNKLTALKKMLIKYDNEKNLTDAKFIIMMISYNFKGENVFLFLTPNEIRILNDIYNDLEPVKKQKRM